ncbi:Transposase domain [Butyrivibrio proteoclasticus]|uniref:Transposase domain n=1 Tax=Butyrivibrio proteoclasticus TaxID=43305 RepID=A0A1I5VUU6_9FIRM|nr:Transposase domain [Butyrivibrio proteoclasticus]
MYKKNQNRQITLKDFDQPLCLKLNPENKWIKKAAMISWDDIEEEYADLFPSGCGMPSKPLRMALGALLIQKKYDYSDREFVEQIQENPYYQYFNYRDSI